MTEILISRPKRDAWGFYEARSSTLRQRQIAKSLNFSASGVMALFELAAGDLRHAPGLNRHFARRGLYQCTGDRYAGSPPGITGKGLAVLDHVLELGWNDPTPWPSDRGEPLRRRMREIAWEAEWDRTFGRARRH